MTARTFVRRAVWAGGLAVGGSIVVIVFVTGEPESSRSILHPPEVGYWLGTEHSGRSVLQLAMRAARTTLIASLTAGLIALIMGVAMGLLQVIRPLSFGASLSQHVANLMDTVGPFLPSVALLSLFPRMPVTSLGILLGLLTWPAVAGPFSVLLSKLLREPYVIAARAMGGSFLHLTRTHLSEPILLMLIPLMMALSSGYLAIISSLQFLGAFSASEVSVGTLFYEGLARTSQAPWILWGAVISFLIGMTAIIGLSFAATRLVRIEIATGSS